MNPPDTLKYGSNPSLPTGWGEVPPVVIGNERWFGKEGNVIFQGIASRLVITALYFPKSW